MDDDKRKVDVHVDKKGRVSYDKRGAGDSEVDASAAAKVREGMVPLGQVAAAAKAKASPSPLVSDAVKKVTAAPMSDKLKEMMAREAADEAAEKAKKAAKKPSASPTPKK